MARRLSPVTQMPVTQMPVTELNHDAARTLSAVRRKLRSHKSLASFLRSARAAFHFGPWRGIARATIRFTHPPKRDATSSSLLPAIEPDRIAQQLRADGVCIAGALPKGMIERLRDATALLPRAEYGAFHEANADVAALVRDPSVLAVVRSYLGAEPVLLECNLVVHDSQPAHAMRAPRPIGPLSQRRFHFDFAGWHSLNLFVYLTDVDEQSGAHEVAVGTHTGKTLRDAVRPSLDDDEALARFGPRIRAITGAAGTMFFEDTEAFHRRGPVIKRRVMLNVLFASHRGLFSRGRLVRPYQSALRRGSLR